MCQYKKMSEIKLSIIIPVYNSSKYLEECLESLVKYNEKFIEIILINDGSTDRSEEICNAYEKKLKNMVFYNNKNMGCSATRNFGIQKSKGDYIMFLDSDDYYLQNINFLELVNKMIQEKIEILIFGYTRKKEENLKIFIPQKTKNKKYLYKSRLYFNIPWNKIYKKSILHDITFPLDIHMGEDLVFNFSAIKNSKNILVLNENYYCYRDNEEGASYDTKKIVQIFKAFTYIFEKFPKKYLDKEQINFLENLYIDNVIIGPYIAMTRLKEKNIDFNYNDILNIKQHQQQILNQYFKKNFYFFEFYGKIRFKFNKIFKLLKRLRER